MALEPILGGSGASRRPEWACTLGIDVFAVHIHES